MPTLVPVIPKKDAKLANNWKNKPVEKLSDAEVMAMPDAEYMNDTQMAFFRLKLVQLKQDILNNAGETTEHLREDTVVVPDPADRATIEEEHALELRTRDRERKLLKKIEQSIARIDAGDVGNGPVGRVFHRDLFLRGERVAHDHAGRAHRLDYSAIEVLRAETVDQYMSRDAALRRTRERIRDCMTRGIGFENIGFEMDLPLRAVNRRLEGRKIFTPGSQEANSIAGDESVHVRFNVDVSAAWSDTRAHTLP